MAIHLDHTIVPAKDKIASAEFFAEIFGLTVTPGPSYFAQVQVNESLTFDFSDESEDWGGPGFDPGSGRSLHYAFHVSEAEFETVFNRVLDRDNLVAAKKRAYITDNPWRPSVALNSDKQGVQIVYTVTVEND